MTSLSPATEAPPRYGMIILFVSLAILIISSDFSLVSVALPSIGRDLAVSPHVLSLIVATYTVVFAGFMILGGRLADLYGQGRCGVIGIVLYAVGACVLATAMNVPMLIAARALQGLGAAILSPASFSLLNTALPEGPIRRRGYGVFASMQGVALILGYVAGGGVTTLLGWRAAFLLNVPVALVAVVLALRFVPRATAAHVKRTPDIAGAFLVTLGTGLLVSALAGLGQSGTLAMAGWMLGAGLAAFGFFFVLERRLASPLVPLAIFRCRNVVSNTVVMIFAAAACVGTFVLPNLYMQQVLHFSAARSGLGMLAQALVSLTVGRFVVFAMRRFSLRQNILIGLALFAAGLFLFAALIVLVPDGGYFINVLPPLIVCAFGSLFAILMLFAGGTMTVPAGDQGVASAVAFTAQQIGMAAGICVLLTVAGSPHATMIEALRNAFAAAAGLAALGLCGMALMTGRYEAAEIEAAHATV